MWLCLPNVHKFEDLEKFKEYKAKVENLLGKKIKSYELWRLVESSLETWFAL